MEDLVIIDGNSLINRAFYALPLLTNSKGEYSNGVYGFANILIKTILEIKPKYIAVALDYGKKTFRNNMYEGYKAKRRPTPEELKGQFPILKEMLKNMGITYIEKNGFEADDIIGTLSKKFNTKNIIITGDKDSLQLIENNTEVWLTKKGITEIKLMNEKSLMEEYGLMPKQIIDLKSLMGDSSDNIPGVMGIGQKTALNLISKYKDLDGVYENLEELRDSLKTKLLNDKDNAYLSKQLAEIKLDVPVEVKLEDLEYKFPFSIDVYNFFKQYEFNSLLKKIDLFDGVEEDRLFKKYSANKIKITSTKEILEQIKNIRISKKFSFELSDNLFSFAYDKNCEFCCNIKNNLLDEGLDLGEIIYSLKEVLEDKNIIKYVYDYKNMLHLLNSYNVCLENVVFDAYLGFYLLVAGEKEVNKENLLNYYKLDKSFESINLFYLTDSILKDLKENNLLELYNSIEFPLIEVLFDMEKTGFKIDVNCVEDLSKRYSNEIAEIVNTIKKLAGCDFNLNSPKQLGDILFNKLGLQCRNNKKKSTSIEHLEEMYELHPIIPAIIRYRKIQKILTTYIDSYKQLIKNSGDIIHTIFNQTNTSTGRLSSSEPNLQNIPIRDDEGKSLRKIFVSRYDNGALVSADYSQIELRLLAHMSKDNSLIESFNNNIDIHSSTASEVFNVEIQNVTPEMRRTAKAVNFGIIYGISEYGLSQNIHSSILQAKYYINQYFERYPLVKEFMKNNIQTVKETGYARTLFNRRRKINELFIPKTRMFGERIAMNMPLQGSASDIIKLAMVNVSKALKENNMKSKLILQVHDELIIDATSDEISAVVKLLKDNMENVVKLSVPLTVDVNSGRTWYDC